MRYSHYFYESDIPHSRETKREISISCDESLVKFHIFATCHNHKWTYIHSLTHSLSIHCVMSRDTKEFWWRITMIKYPVLILLSLVRLAVIDQEAIESNREKKIYIYIYIVGLCQSIAMWKRHYRLVDCLTLPLHSQRCTVGNLPNEPHLHLKGAPITSNTFYFIDIARVAGPGHPLSSSLITILNYFRLIALLFLHDRFNYNRRIFIVDSFSLLLQHFR